MSWSLRQRIFWWSMGSTFVILLAVFIFVSQSFTTTIRSSLEENVRSGALLAAELHRSAVEAGVARVSSLVALPTLRAAVETGDPATVRQNLIQLLPESESAWLAVVGLGGEVVATVGPVSPDQVRAQRGLIEQARFYDAADLRRVGETLEQISASGIFFGSDLLGILLAGETIGRERTEQLELSSGQDVILMAGNRIVAGGVDLSPSGREEFLAAWSDAIPPDGSLEDEPLPVGALPDDALAPDGRITEGDPSIREFSIDGDRHLGMALPIPDAAGNPVAQLVAYRSLDEAMAPSRRLQLALLVIGCGGILLALGFSYVLSRGVTRPIDRLLRETARLGSGDLEHPVTSERNDEVGRLAEGFEAMRSSLLEAQDELIRAERLSALGRASSAIVHDFRQPVTVIQGNVQLLEQDWDDPEARREDFRAIHRELRRLDSMMSEILEFARGDDRVSRARTGVRELLDRIARRHRPRLEASGVTLDLEHGYDGEWALDVSRTTRIVENLMGNAADAIGSDGRIQIRSEASDETLRIRVEDDGPGIPNAVRESLFDPFVTAGKRQGTGLGLAIARSFTEQQGGRISFETSSAGTVFVLEFPWTEEDSPSAGKRGKGPPGSEVGSAARGTGRRSASRTDRAGKGERS